MSSGSGDIQASLIFSPVHPSVQYVPFDFLHEVYDRHDDRFLLDMNSDRRVDFVEDDFQWCELYYRYFVPRVFNEGSCQALSKLFP